MATIRAVVLMTLLVVSLIFADQIQGEQLGGNSNGHHLSPGGGVVPKSECVEQRLYRGPCAEVFCTAACLLEVRQGGHCKGRFFHGGCYCFSCM